MWRRDSQKFFSLKDFIMNGIEPITYSFSLSLLAMDAKCVIFLLITFSTFIWVKSVDRCFQIYECCEKIDHDCVKYCGPFVECYNNEEAELFKTTEVTTTSEEYLETTTQETLPTAVIGVSTCRLGFMLDGKGRCRRVL